MTSLITKESLGNEMVTIFVGEDEEEYTIHKKLICERSSYFRAAFEGGFKEATEGAIYLPEEQPNVFDLFINWLYSNTIASYPKGANKQSMLDSWILYRHSCELFVMGEKFCLNELANRAMDMIQDLTHKFSWLQAQLGRNTSDDWIFTNTTKNSALRQWSIWTILHDEAYQQASINDYLDGQYEYFDSENHHKEHEAYWEFRERNPDFVLAAKEIIKKYGFHTEQRIREIRHFVTHIDIFRRKDDKFPVLDEEPEVDPEVDAWFEEQWAVDSRDDEMLNQKYPYPRNWGPVHRCFFHRHSKGEICHLQT